MTGQKQRSGSNKGYRYGGKQMHGHSRAAYFAQAPLRILANKARRIAKEARKQKKQQEKKQEV